MKNQLKDQINALVLKLYQLDIDIELSRPDDQFGDYATNVALQLAKQLGISPIEVAEALVQELQNNQAIESASVAGPGFINLKLTESALIKSCFNEVARPYEGQVIVAEYSNPNPFKILHAGHIYGSVVGDVVANLLELAGGDVHRVNFGGDVGRHVAISLWSILKRCAGENPNGLNDIKESDRVQWLADCYVEGNAAFESSEIAQAEIKELNRRVYQIINDHDHDSNLAQIYWTCRQWSYDALKQFYERLGIVFERYYPESEVSELGLQTVRQHIPDVYQESEGAVIFDGTKYGLFTNVFINSEGLPTYSAKDVGLLLRKYEDYHYDKSVYVTGNEQQAYLSLVLKSVEQFAPHLVHKVTHLTHGLVKLAGGVKMSSRLGNVLTANAVLDVAKEANKERGGEDSEHITVGAVRYAFLKQGIGGDLIYDPAESVSLEGNSGPYLQYAYARAKNILVKVQSDDNFDLDSVSGLTGPERSLVKKLSEYVEVIDLAVSELKPHHVCTYLYELAQAFNRFYENSRVVGDDRQSLRLKLVELYTSKLKSGLDILGIEAPDKM